MEKKQRRRKPIAKHGRFGKSENRLHWEIDCLLKQSERLEKEQQLIPQEQDPERWSYYDKKRLGIQQRLFELTNI